MTTNLLNEDQVAELIDQRFQQYEQRVDELERMLQVASTQHESAQHPEALTIVSFSGDMDKLMAAFVIATGGASMGLPVSMFFTFWGLAAIRNKSNFSGKSIADKMITGMLPSGPSSVATSRMNMLGVGPKFFEHVMRQKNVQTLPQLITLAEELDVQFVACEMSMRVMGVRPDELRPGVSIGGVASCLGNMTDSAATLFI